MIGSENPIRLIDATIFQGKIPVLHNVNFEVQRGEFVYLVGKTGSGKSSLLKTLYGELPLKEGMGEVAGYNLAGLKPKQVPFLRRKIGIVFQDFQLLTDRSVMKNLLFVLKATGWTNADEMQHRAQEVLNKVGLAHKDYKIPAELSGGEQQRLVIARALLNNPTIVLADEPTGNLDPAISDEIMGILHKICGEGTAVVMATHDYRIIKKFGGHLFKVETGAVTPVQSLE